MALSLGGLVALSGCATSANAGAAYSSEATAVTRQAQTKYDDCLRAAGFAEAADGTAGDPEQDPVFKDPDFLAAAQRCASSSGLDQGWDQPTTVSSDSVEAAMNTLITCLRDRGWQVGDAHREGDQIVPPDMPTFDDDARTAAFNRDFRSCSATSGMDVGDHENLPEPSTIGQ